MLGIFSSLGKDLGIDIGTINTQVYVQGRGIMVSEPSVVATDSKQENIVAIGFEAERLLRKKPEALVQMTPLQEGFIVDYRVTHAMLHYFMHKAVKSLRRSRVILAVPCGITDVEKRAIVDAIIQAGAREAHLIESSVAAALGCQQPIFDALGTMAVDIGGGTTDVGVLSLGGIVKGRSSRCGGNDFNQALLHHIKQTYGVMVADKTVEDIKRSIGSVARESEGLSFEFTGRDISNGLVKRLSITQAEVQTVFEAPFQRMLEVMRTVLEQTPPEIVADIVKQGMILTGDTTMLPGFGNRVATALGVPVHIPDEPGLAVVRGLGLALVEFERMDRFILASKTRKGRA